MFILSCGNIFSTITVLLLLWAHKCPARPILNCNGINASYIVRYLKEFGYLQETFDHWENIASDKQFQIALKSLQKSHGLADTGFIDDATCKLIKEPQCAGMISSDSFNEKKLKHRARRYASFELRWPKTNITWRLVNENMSNLDVDWVKGVLRQALNVWSLETPLNFLEIEFDGHRCDIEVGFSSDIQSMFNTSQRVLGFAIPPNPSKVLLRFDAEQYWTLSPANVYSGSDLLYAAVHEFGHALGLDHSNVEDAIMFPSYKSEFKELHEDDRRGIQSLYGPRGKDPNKKARMLRAMKGIRNRIQWKVFAISEPIRKIFHCFFK